MTVIPFPSPPHDLDDPAPGNPGAALTSSECFAIAAAVRSLPGQWIVQWDEDEGGRASMALLPDCEGERGGSATFLIRREEGRLQLYAKRRGRPAWLGAHPDIGSLIAAASRSLRQGQLSRRRREPCSPE